MILTTANWSVQECVLREVHSKQTLSITGNCVKVLPLDYVLGDILSLSFSLAPTGNNLLPVRNDAWFRIVRNDQNYCDIADCAIDIEDEHTYSDTIFCLLDKFFSLPEDRMTIDNFEWFLAATQTPEPHPHKNVVPKGFWTNGTEDREGVRARDALVASVSGECCSAFLDVLEAVKNNLDLHCNFDVRGFADLALAAAYIVLKAGKTVRRCAYCGCLFSPSRAGEIYCNRVILGDKRQTCKEAAKYQKQLARERASESGKIYKSVSTMLATRADYAKTSEEADRRRAELFAFRDSAKQWRENIKCGAAEETEYIEFLNSFKKRKRR